LQAGHVHDGYAPEHRFRPLPFPAAANHACAVPRPWMWPRSARRLVPVHSRKASPFRAAPARIAPSNWMRKPSRGSIRPWSFSWDWRWFRQGRTGNEN